MRLVLNKADALTTEEIMHVYGGTMWFLGKVFKTPEVKRSYMSSFWDKPLRNPELERFMSEERERLLADLYALPAGARTRKVNDGAQTKFHGARLVLRRVGGARLISRFAHR